MNPTTQTINDHFDNVARGAVAATRDWRSQVA